MAKRACLGDSVLIDSPGSPMQCADPEWREAVHKYYTEGKPISKELWGRHYGPDKTLTVQTFTGPCRKVEIAIS